MTSANSREVFEKCKERAGRIDSVLCHLNLRFTQKLQIASRSGDEDSLTFVITLRNGKFERRLISGSVPNGERFNAGYDAFDRMFLMSEYFSDKGKVLSSCESDDPQGGGSRRIDFAFSDQSDPGDPLSTVSAVVNSYDYTPISISERLKGLPLGMEFDDHIDVRHDKKTGVYFPSRIVMRIYGKFFFLHGEIGKVTIQNEGLEKI